MESDSTKTKAPKKLRFAPKAPTRKPPPKTVIPKAEKIEDADDKLAKELIRRFSENAATRRQKLEKKVAPSQVAFGYGGEPSSMRYVRKGGDGGPSGGQSVGKEYKEPWDYHRSYYPVSLPLRRPYMGNPELLDEEEFGGSSESTSYDENLTIPARDLGLMEDVTENPEEKLIYFQFPATLPIIKKFDVQATAGSSIQQARKRILERAYRLDELPGGHIGKLLVYGSGAIKLKLGDTLYDVSTGLDCQFAQDLVTINAEEKQCCAIGELTHRAVVTPDVDSIIESMANLED